MGTDQESLELDSHYERAFLWPDVKRRVFQTNATREGVDLGSYRDRGEAEFRYHYRNSYERAVDVLYEEACRSSRRDSLVLPLMFLWRHLIEVSLKDLIREARELFFEEPSKPEAEAMRKHDLTALWRLAIPHVKLLGCNAPELSNLENIFNEIHEADPYADGFRYPFGRDGRTKNLERLPETMDLGQMNDSLRGALNFLSAGFSEVQRRRDFFSDYEIEMAREYGWPEPEELGRARRAYCEQDDGVDNGGV